MTCTFHALSSVFWIRVYITLSRNTEMFLGKWQQISDNDYAMWMGVIESEKV